jgi:hypothetical protein
MMTGLFVIGGIVVATLVVVLVVLAILDRCEAVDPEDPE